MSAGSDSKNTEFLNLKASLCDTVTRLPSYAGCFRQLRKMAADGTLGVVFFQISDLENIESVVGFEGYEAILKRVAFCLQDVNNRKFGGQLLVTQRNVFDDQFLVFIPHEILSGDSSRTLQTVSQELFDSLQLGLSSYDDIETSIRMGFSLLRYNTFLRFERLVHRTVNKTALAAQREKTTEQVLRGLELTRILDAENISSVYQPIVSLEDFTILGFEALARGPVGTPYERPDTLFSLAREARLSNRLDMLCKQRAVMGACDKPEGTKLFINTLPTTLEAPDFLEDTGLEWLRKNNLSPSDIVWELNERQNIKNYKAFGRVMERYRSFGYQVAIDDLGTGYSSIQTTTQVKPAYIKADRSLVTGIGSNLLKRELISSLQVLAKTLGAILIAEGIEMQEDLEVIRSLGLKYGQGYLFGRPVPDFATKIDL